MVKDYYSQSHASFVTIHMLRTFKPCAIQKNHLVIYTQVGISVQLICQPYVYDIFGFNAIQLPTKKCYTNYA